MLKWLWFWLLTLPATAVELEWNANTETNLAGYRLYQAGITGIYTNVTAFGLTTTAILPLTNIGVYHFALSAINGLGQESDVSDECVWTNGVPLTNAPPFTVGLRWTNHMVFWRYDAAFCDRLEWSSDLRTWTTISNVFMMVKNGEWQVIFSPALPVRFFRVRRALVCVP